MDTLLLNGNNTNDIERVGAILRAGGLAAIPTETVYGLAANALDGPAVKRIFAAKGRPSDNPLIVHICRFDQLASLVREVPQAAEKLAKAFWPGPLTMILPKSALVPTEVSGGLDTVAVRFPAHPAAQAVIRAAGVPLAAPSANLSGRPSPTTFAHVKADLTGRVEALLDGGDCQVGVESTVITLAETPPRLLRPGGITLDQLQAVLGRVEVDPAVLHRLEEGKKAASPGMKYKHYAPKADVVLVDASPKGYSDYVNQRKNCHALCFEEDLPFLRGPFLSYGSRYDSQTQARRLFSALHELDQLGAEKVYAHLPSKRGVGLAVYNRLIRAAGFQVEVPGERRVVGLTGPSGAGKSTVGGLLKAAGCAVIDCDALTRSPAVYDNACVLELRQAFGERIAPGGVLDRKALAREVFSSPERKKRLEEIVFPRILRAVEEEVSAAFAAEGCWAAVLDAPTLFEAGLDSSCARILAVTAPEKVRLERVLRRDGITEEQARLRFAAQRDESFYTDRADYVIENGGDADLPGQLAPVLEDLREGE